MKQDLHPTFYPEAKVICACGNTWTTGSTVEEIHTDVCSQCHPFFTGEQRIVDTEGQVDRFYKKLQARQEYLEVQQAREEAQTSPDMAVSDLELGTRIESTLAEAGIEIVGQALERMAKGDQAMLEIDGFGRKSLADLKRALKRQGFELPEAAAEPQV
jgi:large subunit ribosomal protein L31